VKGKNIWSKYVRIPFVTAKKKKKNRTQKTMEVKLKDFCSKDKYDKQMLAWEKVYATI
jgi:cell division protein FtsB